MESVEFHSTLQKDTDYIKYLQDALELPYWDFILSAFIECKNRDPNNALATATLDTMKMTKRSCHKLVEALMAEVTMPDDQQSLRILRPQIEKRLDLLQSFLLASASDPDDFHNDASSKALAVNISEAHPEQPEQMFAAKSKTDVPEVRLPFYAIRCHHD